MGRKLDSVWTPATVECYKNNCVCSSACANYEICKRVVNQAKVKQPPIKKIVESLINGGVAIPLVMTNMLISKSSEGDISIIEGLINEKSLKQIARERQVTEGTIIMTTSKAMSKFRGLYSINVNETRLQAFKNYAKKYLKEEIKTYRKIGAIV